VRSKTGQVAAELGIKEVIPELHQLLADKLQSPEARANVLPALLTLKDPDDGAPIVRAVYKRDDVYSGEYLGNASELQVGMEDGYRVSWQTTLGGSPQGIVYPNMKKWSGDHGGYDYATTSGVLISSRPVSRGPSEGPSIMDIAPTVLKYFGVPIPGDIDGKPLF